MEDLDKRIEKIFKIATQNKVCVFCNVKRKEFELFHKYNDNNKLGFNIIDINNSKLNEYIDIKYKNKTILLTNYDYDKLCAFKENFYILDFYRITDKYNYLFLSDFESFKFSDFYEEEKNKSYIGVKWENKKNNRFNIGDIIYVYLTHYPDGINRIMMKYEVIDDGYHFNKNDILYFDDDKKTNAIRVKNICLFDSVDNKFKFSRDNLEKYGVKINNYFTKQAISDELVKEIESEINKYKNYDKRKTFKEFSQNVQTCIFSDCKNINFDYNHKSFKKENGFYHFEIHHLIEQCNTNRIDKNIAQQIIYNNVNEIPLCLNCHSRIHKGLINDRIEMVMYLYNNRREQFDKLLDMLPSEIFKDYSNFKNKKLAWLINQYVNLDDIKINI